MAEREFKVSIKFRIARAKWNPADPVVLSEGRCHLWLRVGLRDQLEPVSSLTLVEGLATQFSNTQLYIWKIKCCHEYEIGNCWLKVRDNVSQARKPREIAAHPRVRSALSCLISFHSPPTVRMGLKIPRMVCAGGRPSGLTFADDWKLCGGSHWLFWVMMKKQGRHYLLFYWIFQHMVKLGVLLSHLQ